MKGLDTKDIDIISKVLTGKQKNNIKDFMKVLLFSTEKAAKLLKSYGIE